MKTATASLALSLTLLMCQVGHCQVVSRIDSTSHIYEKVDVMPEFPGGTKALGKYVDGKNHHYPKEARQNNIEGMVVIQFIINEDGTPTNFEVVKGIGYGCDEAALEAFMKMPKWKPGTINNKPVKVRTKMRYAYKL